MADECSCLFHLSNSQFLHHFNTTFPQKSSFHLVHPRSEMLSGVISALQRKTCPVECLQGDLQPPTLIGKPGPNSQITWASIPFSKPSRTKYLSYKSSPDEFDPASYQQEEIPPSLDRLKITYGVLDRRSSPWGNPIPG